MAMIDKVDTTRLGPSGEVFGTAQTADVAGAYRGETVVRQADAQSLIADAAEELTFGAAETVETKLTERKTEARGERSTALERALFYLQRLPDAGKPEKFQAFLEHLKKNGQSSAEEALREAKNFFKDVSHQFAGLSFADELLAGEEGLDDLKAAVKEALRQLDDASGPEIRAGLNVSEVAAAYADKGLGEVGRLRDFYRDTVLKYEGLSETYKSILEQYKPEELPAAADFLIKSLGNDLASKGPSADPAELKQIMDDLYTLETLANIHRDCGVILSALRNKYGAIPLKGADDLMARIMSLKDDKWPRPDQFAALAGEFGMRDSQTEIAFLRGAKELVRQAPLRIFQSLESRDGLLSAMQQALDAAIDNEQ